MSLSWFLLLSILPLSFAIECYTGFKFIKGTSVGGATIKCDNSAAYCYNMTASAAQLIEVTKAGCSMWRCMFAQNKCISTTFQNIPISLCCCSGDLCNVGDSNPNAGGAIQPPQNSGGWNAEPEHNKEEVTKDEAERRFSSAELDDDQHHQSSRPARLASPTSPIDEVELLE